MVLVASALAWRAWSPAHRAPHASPPEGCATWSAWVARAATPDLVACTTQPVDVTAPLGPVSVDGALFLPMGWRAEALEAPIAPGVAVFRVTARDGRIAILLVASDEAGSPVIAEEPGLAVARRVVAGRSCTELALSGPPFVLGALSGGR
ncbi:MAG: hypothetical protein IPJ77_16165 [Planctomycetes bacterium]|nr:hypothetical protein [Planctomycetota bacterium]